MPFETELNLVDDHQLDEIRKIPLASLSLLPNSSLPTSIVSLFMEVFNTDITINYTIQLL